MPDQALASPAAIGVSAVTLLTWAFTLAGLTSLTGSDPAGNAMTQGFTALGLIVLWILLAVAALIGAKKGAMPRAAGIAALLLRRPGSPR